VTDNDTTDQQTFATYGNETPPPKVARKRPVTVEADRTRLVGFVGYDRCRDKRVYTTRRKDYHFYETGGGYAISEAVLDQLTEIGIPRILIHEYVDGDGDEDEAETGDVFEFQTHQYVHADIVGEAWPFENGDTQRYVPIEATLFDWPGHAGDLFVRPFDEAMDTIARHR
jgi:hypothetical protein